MNKKMLFCWFVVIIAAAVDVLQAQRSFSTTKPPAISFSYVNMDFLDAQAIGHQGLRTAFKNHQVANATYFNPGLAIGFLKGFTPHIDWWTSLAGSSLKYLYKSGAQTSSSKLLLELESSVLLKYFPDSHWWTPFVSFGLTASKYQNDFAFSLPVGLGIQFIVQRDIYLSINAEYRAAVTALAGEHLYYGVSIAGNIGKRLKVKRLINHVPTSQKATVINFYSGSVPVRTTRRDTDQDGLYDDEDSCVTVPGVLRLHGCPVPPDNSLTTTVQRVPGTHAEDQQVLDLAAEHILFVTGSFSLRKQSTKPLLEVVALLRDHLAYLLSIEGHTDNAGNSAGNLLLSNHRAKTVRDYLVQHGIECKRLTYQGFGETQPAAGNGTPDGRSQNRRVVFHIHF